MTEGLLSVYNFICKYRVSNRAWWRLSVIVVLLLIFRKGVFCASARIQEQSRNFCKEKCLHLYKNNTWIEILCSEDKVPLFLCGTGGFA
jgi:hypothetical protein